ncbi:hypothetical protein [Pseudactinotalea sp. Z1748]|uniref:hypothetical protein n=1 Tax=Pseudactinotalea sp. Z1748 TaxID=3413027 RepID=UPI003C7CDDB9
MSDQPQWDDQDIAAWVTTLGQPLVRPGLATQIARQARTTMALDAPRARYWLTGVIGDLVASLPEVDPWRALSARVPVEGEADITLLGTAPPPPGLGAASATGEFGTWRDGADLVPASHANLLIDRELIVLVEGLAPASAAVLALCGSDYHLGVRALQVLGAEGPESFDIAAPALRWALWRRQVYTGPEDTWAHTTALMWLHYAAQLASGEVFDTASWQADRAEGALPAYLYDPVQTRELP